MARYIEKAVILGINQLAVRINYNYNYNDHFQSIQLAEDYSTLTVLSQCSHSASQCIAVYRVIKATSP